MKKSKPYFEGWYFKQQNEKDTLVLIPGMHREENGKEKAFIQVMFQNQSWYIPFAADQFHYREKPFCVQIGENHFSKKGVNLRISYKDLHLSGKIKFGSWKALQSDIMGPFAKIPFMQCSHGILSMGHRMNGTIAVNGEMISFDGGRGYVEKDAGCSFPESYLWTQCNYFDQKGTSITLAIASIPFLGFQFDGCICAIMHQGREYRLATYKGVRIKRNKEGSVFLKQGNYKLYTSVMKSGGQVLKAPEKGSMKNHIYETADTQAHYKFISGSTTVFDLKSDRAALEIVE